MNPSAIVAARMLAGLGIRDRHTAQLALVIWCRPAPRLSLADVEAIMAQYPAESDDGLRAAHAPRPRTGDSEPGGFPVGGEPGRRAHTGGEEDGQP